MASATAKADLLHGMIAEFDDADTLLAAATKAHASGYTQLDAYSPFPVHGLDDAIGFSDNRVQWAIFGAGFMGLLVGYGLEIYTSYFFYPFNSGGRPKISWPSFIPVAYEATILFAGLTAMVAMLALNGLPRPNHPIFNAQNFDRASQDRFFLCIESHDPKYDASEVKKFLNSFKPLNVSEVYGDEPEGY